MKSFKIPQKRRRTATGKAEVPFRSMPTMLISSEDSEEARPPRFYRAPSAQERSAVEVYEVPKDHQQSVRVKLTEMTPMMIETYNKILEREAEERAEIARNPVVRKTDPKLVEELETLKKKFPLHSYLPIEVLRELRAELKKVPMKCMMERSPTDLIYNLRNDQRQKLTFAVRLALAELKHKVKPEEYSEFERELTQSTTDLLETAFMLACEIEEVVHRKQFLEGLRVSGQEYKDQMVLITSQLKDPLNMEFHRQVLNHTYDLQRLAVIREKDLMSEKAKERERKMIQQYLRENQVQRDEPEDEEEQPVVLYGYNQKLEEDRRREAERERERQRERERERLRREENPPIPLSVVQLERTKKIAKQTYSAYLNKFRSISRRVAQMKEKYSDLRSMANLNDFVLNFYPS